MNIQIIIVNIIKILDFNFLIDYTLFDSVTVYTMIILSE